MNSECLKCKATTAELFLKVFCNNCCINKVTSDVFSSLRNLSSEKNFCPNILVACSDGVKSRRLVRCLVWLHREALKVPCRPRVFHRVQLCHVVRNRNLPSLDFAEAIADDNEFFEQIRLCIVEENLKERNLNWDDPNQRLALSIREIVKHANTLSADSCRECVILTGETADFRAASILTGLFRGSESPLLRSEYRTPSGTILRVVAPFASLHRQDLVDLSRAFNNNASSSCFLEGTSIPQARDDLHGFIQQSVESALIANPAAALNIIGVCQKLNFNNMNMAGVSGSFSLDAQCCPVCTCITPRNRMDSLPPFAALKFLNTKKENDESVCDVCKPLTH